MAIIGRVYTSLYASRLLHSGAAPSAGDALHHAQSIRRRRLHVAAHVPAAYICRCSHSVQNAFMDGLHAGCLVAAGVCVVGVIGAMALPGARRTRAAVAEGRLVPDPAPGC